MARTTDKEAKRQQIINGALRVFARRGLSNFKMAEVAEEAQVGKGTLYEYFRTKEELIIGSVSQFMIEFEEYVAAQIVTAPGPIEKIETMVQASVEFCLENEDRLDALLDFYAVGIPRSGDGPALMDLGPRYKGVIQWVSTVIKEGIDQGLFRQVDPEFVASMIVALLDGFFFQAAIGAIEMEPKHISRNVCDLLLKGLVAKTENDKIGE
jgi:AcrR family transcriptional regulator